MIKMDGNDFRFLWNNCWVRKYFMEFLRYLCNVKRFMILKRGWCFRVKSDFVILGFDDGYKYLV